MRLITLLASLFLSANFLEAMDTPSSPYLDLAAAVEFLEKNLIIQDFHMQLPAPSTSIGGNLTLHQQELYNPMLSLDIEAPLPVIPDVEHIRATRGDLPLLAMLTAEKAKAPLDEPTPNAENPKKKVRKEIRTLAPAASTPTTPYESRKNDYSTLNQQQCPECNAFCSKRETLIDHIASAHLALQPYQCLILGCQKRYRQKSALNKHLKNDHHTDITHTLLAEMELSATKKKALALNPILKKLGWKESCHQCGLLFPKLKSMTNHLKTHHKDPSSSLLSKKQHTE